MIWAAILVPFSIILSAAPRTAPPPVKAEREPMVPTPKSYLIRVVIHYTDVIRINT